MEMCIAKSIIDRLNPNIRHFRCLNGLIIIANLSKEVDDVHEYEVYFERRTSKAGKEYGTLVRYEVIHDLSSPKVAKERSEITYNRYGDHYIRTVTTRRLMVYKCRRCSYEEMDEDKDTHDEEVNIIAIDNIPYLVDYSHLTSLQRLDTTAPEAEVKYVKVHNYYIPQNFIDEEVMSRIEELVKKVEELDKRIQYINSYDVYLTGLGKFAKKVTNETKQYDPQHDQQVVIEEAYYVLENGTKITKEIVKHRNYKCRQYLVPGRGEDWELRRECEFTETEVLETHDYGEIPTFKTQVYNDYMKEKDGLEQEIKKLLQQMVRSRVEVITQKDDGRVKITVNGDEAEFVYDWMHGVEYYKGKYGPLARLF